MSIMQLELFLFCVSLWFLEKTVVLLHPPGHNYMSKTCISHALVL